MTFALADGRLQLDLSGKICDDGLPAAAWHVLRTAIVNLLKTGCVEVLHRTNSGLPAADAAADRQDISLLYVAWSDWIAAWETDGLPEKAAWDRLAVI